MKLEALKEHLSEETLAKVEEELKDKDIKLVDLKQGGYVNVDKYNTLEKDLETTKAELDNRTADLTKLQESEGLTEELKQKLETIKTEHEQKELEYQEKLKQNQINAYVDRVVLKSGTIDDVSLKAHLQGFLKDAEFKDGQVLGLEEQVNSLKEEHTHLFGTPKGTGVKHKDPVPREQTLEENLSEILFNKK